MAYTLTDFIKLNPTYKSRYDPTTKTAYLSNTGTGKEISFTSGQGQQYGLGALQNDSNTISDVNRLISSLGGSTTTQSQYTSPYSDRIGKTLAAIQGRSSFSYDPEDDEGLQAAQESASGTVSREAARRGMLYSDSNKSQMGKAALALVPQYREQAYNEYNQQGQTLLNQINTLLGLENQAYGQYRDTVGDALSQQQLAQNRELSMLPYSQLTAADKANLERQAALDALAQTQWEANPESDPRYKELALTKLQRDAYAPYSSGGSGSGGGTQTDRNNAATADAMASIDQAIASGISSADLQEAVSNATSDWVRDGVNIGTVNAYLQNKISDIETSEADSAYAQKWNEYLQQQEDYNALPWYKRLVSRDPYKDMK